MENSQFVPRQIKEDWLQEKIEDQIKKPITLQEAITKDIGEIGTPERDKFEKDLEKELDDWRLFNDNLIEEYRNETGNRSINITKIDFIRFTAWLRQKLYEARK